MGFSVEVKGIQAITSLTEEEEAKVQAGAKLLGELSRILGFRNLKHFPFLTSRFYDYFRTEKYIAERTFHNAMLPGAVLEDEKFQGHFRALLLQARDWAGKSNEQKGPSEVPVFPDGINMAISNKVTFADGEQEYLAMADSANYYPPAPLPNGALTEETAKPLLAEWLKAGFEEMSKSEYAFNRSEHLLYMWGPYINVFRTENGFHFYGTKLHTKAEWVEQFLPTLLLGNEKTEFIDTRWVGHSLRKGQSWLRVTNFGVKRVLPTYFGAYNVSTKEFHHAD